MSGRSWVEVTDHSALLRMVLSHCCDLLAVPLYVRLLYDPGLSS